MTQLGARTRGPRHPGTRGEQGNALVRLLGSLRLFVSQILDELRKVVRPTRSELWNYTLVVIVFVSVMMAFTASLDFVFTKLVLWVFGG